MPTCWHWAGLVTPGTVATLLARSRHMEWLTAGQHDSWIEGVAGPAQDNCHIDSLNWINSLNCLRTMTLASLFTPFCNL